MSTFWNLWVIVITSIVILGSVWLLFATRKIELPKSAMKDGEAPTTGHVYDGIEEYDNPLPKWWFNMFIYTVIFSIIYLILYPGMGNFKGMLGWTSIGKWEADVAQAEIKYAPIYARYRDMDIEEIIADVDAVKMGQRLFNNNCSVCHGSDGRGSYGFPNLADNEWLYGGSAEAIKTSITNGRNGVMPALGAAIGEDGVDNVTDYIFSLSGREHDAEKADLGSQVYKTLCIACHAADGTGNVLLGAPDLTNGVWLYGGSPALVKESIRNGRAGQMPAQKGQLKEDKIHLLSAYVYRLSKVQ